MSAPKERANACRKFLILPEKRSSLQTPLYFQRSWYTVAEPDTAAPSTHHNDKHISCEPVGELLPLSGELQLYTVRWRRIQTAALFVYKKTDGLLLWIRADLAKEASATTKCKRLDIAD